MIGLSALSPYSAEIQSLMLQAKAAMAQINATPMDEGARRGAIASYNELLTDAEVLTSLAQLGALIPEDFREFKRTVQGFTAFAADPASFGVQTPTAVATATTEPVPSPPVTDAVPAQSEYVKYGLIAAGVAAVGGVAWWALRKKGRR